MLKHKKSGNQYICHGKQKPLTVSTLDYYNNNNNKIFNQKTCTMKEKMEIKSCLFREMPKHGVQSVKTNHQFPFGWILCVCAVSLFLTVNRLCVYKIKRKLLVSTILPGMTTQNILNVDNWRMTNDKSTIIHHLYIYKSCSSRGWFTLRRFSFRFLKNYLLLFIFRTKLHNFRVTVKIDMLIM